MKKIEPSLVDEYEKLRPIYEKCTEKFKSLVKDIIKESELKTHSITSRTKEIESFSKKVLGKTEKYKEASDVSDLAGVRICCYLSSQIENVAKLIRDNFIIIPELSIDKKDTLDPDRFGYLSLHYVVKLSKTRANLPEFKRYKDLLCEIQIRTILQHAWAEIEHDLGYKSDTEIPGKIRRQFSRLAGLLELADEQFDNIKLQIEDYYNEVEKKLFTEPKEVAIDKVSLKTFILAFPFMKELDEKITEILGYTLREVAKPEHGIKICNYFNIKSIQELKGYLKEEKERMIKIAKKFKEENPLEKRGDISRGISLGYLGYALISKLKSIDTIKDYCRAIAIFSDDFLEEGVHDLLKVFEKIEEH